MREVRRLVDWWYGGTEFGNLVGKKGGELLSDGGGGKEVRQRECSRPMEYRRVLMVFHNCRGLEMLAVMSWV